jgi:NhaA family Na+:H+ antiporter
MATDIAFSIGVLALLGSRVPTPLKVFLTALAIVDDLGAVAVIAIFYTDRILWLPFLLAILLLGAIVLAGRLRIRRLEIYIILIAGVWAATFFSGVHATVAGVLIALTIPVQTRSDPNELLRISRQYVEELEQIELTPASMIHDREQYEILTELDRVTNAMRPIGLTLEEYFHPLLAWIILPLFALFNAGVQFTDGLLASLLNSAAVGIIFGLVIGKQIGVTLFTWLAVRMGWADLPEGVTWRQVYGAAWLCGIGFTMSLFVTELAFHDAALINAAKIGILAGSLIAGLGGYLLLNLWLPPQAKRLEQATTDVITT